jgi:hypothetical protein
VSDFNGQAIHPVTIEFLEWVAVRTRTYNETMDAWQTSCPRLSVWEDCIIDGLVRLERPAPDLKIVTLTDRGRAIVSLS